MSIKKRNNTLSVLVISVMIISFILLNPPLMVTAQSLPAGMKEQHLTAEAVYESGIDVYFDESGNQIEDYASSYYGATYKLKYVIDFWNSGALSPSIDKKYSTATIIAVFAPDGPAYVSNEQKMYDEAMSPWKDKHFDEYKNDPAWIEANKNLEAEIEAIKNKDLPTLNKPVMSLNFTGGPSGTFMDPDKSETVGNIAQKGGLWLIEFTKGINHSAHSGCPSASGDCVFRELKILSDSPFGVEGTDSGARFSDFYGNVEVQPAAEDYWNLAELGMILYFDDHIRTNIESMAVLSFKDMTTYKMKPETEIVLSRPTAAETKLHLVIGNLWINVKKMIKDGTMEITMNQAVLGIKGTILVCEQTGTTSTVKVIEGVVEFVDNNGEIVKIGAGEKVSATSSGMSPVEKFNIYQENKTWAEYWDNEDKTNKSENYLSFIIGGSAITIVVILGFLFMISKRKRNRK